MPLCRSDGGIFGPRQHSAGSGFKVGLRFSAMTMASGEELEATMGGGDVDSIDGDEHGGLEALFEQAEFGEALQRPGHSKQVAVAGDAENVFGSAGDAPAGEGACVG